MTHTGNALCSIPWNPLYMDPAAPMPINSVLLARNVTGVQPEQIHLTYWAADAVVVSWATGEGVTSITALPEAEQLQDGVATVVLYGTESGNLTHFVTGWVGGPSHSWPACSSGVCVFLFVCSNCWRSCRSVIIAAAAWAQSRHPWCVLRAMQGQECMYGSRELHL